MTVESPDFAWIHPKGRRMYVCPDPNIGADEVIDLLHVTKPATGKRAGRNGGGGKRRR